METKNFESSKNEILKRAKEANACSSQYDRAYKADNVTTLDSSSANVRTWGSSSKLTKEVKSQRSYIRSHSDNTIYVLTDSDLRLKNG